MDMITYKQLEQLVDNTYTYVGIMIAVSIVSFNVGLLIGWTWVSVL